MVGNARSFPPQPASVAEARRFVRSETVATSIDRDDLDLLTSELATNAVRHANSSFTVRVIPRTDAVRVEVADHSPELVLINREPTTTGGRGLHLLEQIASAWGVESDDNRKVVWFEVEALT